MDLAFTLKNYRCFSDSNPARFRVRNGITAFLGVNNSGKSTVLRFFHELRPLFSALADRKLPDLIFAALRSTSSAPAFGTQSVADQSDVFCHRNDRPLEFVIEFSDSSRGEPNGRVQLTLTTVNRSSHLSAKVVAHRHALTDDQRGRLGRRDNDTRLFLDDHPFADFAPLCEFSRQMSSALYVGPFRNAINIGAKSDYYDIHVGEAFVRLWDSFKAGPVRQNRDRCRQVESDIARIFGLKRVEINASQDSTTLQIFVGDQQSYALSDFGAGLTQFLLVLANVAVKRPPFVLIDEPELNLHPSLQLDFLTTLSSYASSGVLFATHSYGLARGAADEVFVVRIEGDERVMQPIGAMPRPALFLGELSYSGYRELGFDKVLLVEGPTDVKVVQQFLRLFGKDHQVVIVPMAGDGSINTSEDTEAQLIEVQRITPNVLALIDSERDRAAGPLKSGRQGFVDNCEKAGIHCHVLDRRAMENYFTDRAIKAVWPEQSALSPYEARNGRTNSWSKRENWKVANRMTFDELQGTDLGVFLESL
jgi:ABC-type Na+ transport system ATPase subunit NatA